MATINWDSEPINNFTIWEAQCKCGCRLIILQTDLLEALASTRLEFDHPIKVNSWTRCKKWNEQQGSKANSYHLNGRAVDITVRDMVKLDELEQIARKHFKFVIRYDWGLHCDVRGKRPVML